MLDNFLERESAIGEDKCALGGGMEVLGTVTCEVDIIAITHLVKNALNDPSSIFSSTNLVQLD